MTQESVTIEGWCSPRKIGTPMFAKVFGPTLTIDGVQVPIEAVKALAKSTQVCGECSSPRDNHKHWCDFAQERGEKRAPRPTGEGTHAKEAAIDYAVIYEYVQREECWRNYNALCAMVRKAVRTGDS